MTILREMSIRSRLYALVALAVVLGQGAAMAQCSTGSNPSPPPPLNQTANTPTAPVDAIGNGEPGVDQPAPVRIDVPV